MRKISIGLPVFNEEKNIKKVLNNIISQNYRNKEVIISDNCSKDLTGLICRKFSKKFKFIKYYRQKKKIDLFKNFNFVLKKSKGYYFTWQAADDLRSKNFLNNNVNFLDKNLSYVASTGISKLDKKKFLINRVSFAFDGSLHSRIWTFIFYKWLLKGILDSVIRIKIIRKFPFNNFPNYFARDWTVIFFLILSGKINRDRYSHAKIGSKGISFKNDAVILQRYNKKDFIEKLFPFYYFTKHSLVLIKSQKFITKIYLFFFLIILNFFIYPRMFLKNYLDFFKRYFKLTFF
jgi:glycosyltransferase involved in cell wall biosynthesis